MYDITRYVCTIYTYTNYVHLGGWRRASCA